MTLNIFIIIGLILIIIEIYTLCNLQKLDNINEETDKHLKELNNLIREYYDN